MRRVDCADLEAGCMVTKRAMLLSIGAARFGISGSVGFVSEFYGVEFEWRMVVGMSNG